MDKAVKTTGPVVECQIDKTDMAEAIKTAGGTILEGQTDKTEMDKAVKTTGQVIEGQIDKTDMDEAIKTTGGTIMQGQIGKTEMDKAVKTTGTAIHGQSDKTENRPRQHQAEPSGSGPSRSIRIWCGFKEPDIGGREDNKKDSRQLSRPTDIKESSGSGSECESSSADKDEVGGDDAGGLSMTKDAIANIWEPGPRINNDEAWAYYYF